MTCVDGEGLLITPSGLAQITDFGVASAAQRLCSTRGFRVKPSVRPHERTRRRSSVRSLAVPPAVVSPAGVFTPRTICSVLRRAEKLLICSFLVAVLRTAGALAQSNADAAQARFDHGCERFNSGDYATALEDFRASMALYSSPNSHFFLARCLRELGRLSEAVSEYQRTIEEAGERGKIEPRYLQTRDAARRELQAVEARVGRMVLSSPGFAANNLVSGTAVGPRIQHVVPTHERNRAVGTRSSSAAPWLKTIGWASVGVGAVGLGMFLGFGIATEDRWHQVHEMCTTVCNPGQVGILDSGRTFETISNISLGVGAAAAAVGVALVLLGSAVEGSSVPRERAQSHTLWSLGSFSTKMPDL